MKGLVDVFALGAILYILGRLAIYTAEWLFGLISSRFDIPSPVGVHGMPADHPEQVPAELTDEELAAFIELVSNTEWGSK